MTVIGVDPGSRSWSIVVLEPNSNLHETRLSSEQVKKQPKQISDFIRNYENVQMVVGPSGYGLPLKSLTSLTMRDFALVALKHPSESRILGLTEVLGHFQSAKIPGFVLPGVIHLPTVPKHRKLNRIDMGTPDKVCSVAATLKALSEREGLNWEECCFVLVEAGSAFTAVIGVQYGKIVDGIGGTEGCMGFQARGGMDGEFCYLIKSFQKEFLYRGGFLDVIGKCVDPVQIDQEFLQVQTHRDGWNSLIEETAKDVISVALSCNPDYVVLSGSLAMNPLFSTFLKKTLENSLQLEFFSLSQFSNIKGAALGAAYLADGLRGGAHAGLVDILELRRASGTCLDYLNLNKELEIDL